MKLVRIAHSRCSDYDGYTLAFAPDDWDEDKIEGEVSLAQGAYLEQYVAAMKDEQGPPFPGWHPNYAAHPKRLVGEVDAEHRAAMEEYNVWKRVRDEQATRFETFLTRRGFVLPWQDEAGAVEVDVDWGHRHGQHLAYGGAQKEFPTPEALAGRVSEFD